MDPELICKWLGLPNQNWPPDHYTLLGLEPRETDCARIEQRVHDRLASVRCYQLSHPATATEVMNRLAQAYMCLTDRQAKKAYDAQMFPHLPPRPEVPPPQAQPQPAAAPALLVPETVVATLPPPRAAEDADTLIGSTQTQLDWHTAPPVRVAVAPESAPESAPVAAPVADPAPSVNGHPAPAPQASVAAPTPRPKPADPELDSARSSFEARRGLGTRAALDERLKLTQSLLAAWDTAGKYLSDKKRALKRKAEESELTKALHKLDTLLQEFPPVLGQPGRPGYRVAALAAEENITPVFKAMGFNERDAVEKDWTAGRQWLLTHKEFVEKEQQALRRAPWPSRLARLVCTSLNDHPLWVFVGVVVIVAAVAASLLLG